MDSNVDVNIEARKQLTQLYPYLIPRKCRTGEIHKDYDYSYVVGEHDLPQGWFKLFLQCCEDILEPLEKNGCLNKFRFLQVKEKYGSMRLYSNGAPEEVLQILDKYELLSGQVCCICGKPAALETDGYICPYCNDCIIRSGENPDSAVSIKIKTSYTHTIYHDGNETRTEVSMEDEWNRYLERLNSNEV